MLTVDQARVVMVEAALPLGDDLYTAEEKKRAIRMILEEGLSYNETEHRLKREDRPFNRMTIVKWVSEFESRVQRACEMERRLVREETK